jgi:predicted DNA-binding protein (MmcQ/YjbR family)
VKTGKQATEALLAHALTYPGAWEDNPWGERVAKVAKKVFVFLGVPTPKAVSVSVKLPSSGSMALTLPFATATGYGLGKAGWVTARFEGGDDVPQDLLEAWIEESYRAVAPKTLCAKLDQAPDTKAKPKRVAKPKPARKRSKPR